MARHRRFQPEPMQGRSARRSRPTRENDATETANLSSATAAPRRLSSAQQASRCLQDRHPPASRGTTQTTSRIGRWLGGRFVSLEVGDRSPVGDADGCDQQDPRRERPLRVHRRRDTPHPRRRRHGRPCQPINGQQAAGRLRFPALLPVPPGEVRPRGCHATCRTSDTDEQTERTGRKAQLPVCPAARCVGTQAAGDRQQQQRE